MSTPDRSDAEALRARLALLEQQLADLSVRREEIVALEQSETRLTSEIESLRKRLDAMAPRRLRVLDDVRVASPCHVAWDAMTGDDRDRFCAHCEKHVYNLSGMTRDEAERFVLERARDVCIRFYRRRDGTILTSDCPVGKRKRARRWGAVAALASMAVSALAVRGYASSDRVASTLRKLGIEAPDVENMDEVMGDMVPIVPQTARPPATPPAPGSLAVTKTKLSLFDSPGRAVIGAVPEGEIVMVNRLNGEWAMVTYVADDAHVAVKGWTLKHLVQ